MAWEWLEKYLKGGLRTQGVPDVIGGEVPTRGLFGTGGQYGQGGLLTTFDPNPAAMESLGEAFSNPWVLGALRGMQSGAKGQNIMQAAPEAIISGVKDAYTIGKFKKFQKEKKAIEKLLESDEISDLNKLLIAAGKNPLPDKKGSFQKKAEYIADNTVFTKGEIINILLAPKDTWTKKRFMAETYTRSVAMLGVTGAKNAAEKSGEFWDSNISISGKSSGTDLSTFTLTDAGSKLAATLKVDGSVTKIVELMKIKHPDSTIEEIIQSLKEQNIIQ